MALTQVTTDVIANNTISSSDLNTNIYFPGRNRIINGAMVIDQRHAGASVTPASGAYTYITDRWYVAVNQSNKLTSRQSSTAPSGFSRSLQVVSSSAYSLVSTDIFCMSQKIEGFNCYDFAWGTANAKPVTVSFKVRSSLTGTFGGVVRNSLANMNYPFTYTISSADTFEDKTITIPGATTGTWSTDNSSGVELIFGLGMGSNYVATAGAWTSSFVLSATGSTSLVGTNGATWYITGVQLEEGSTATSFEHRLYGQELSLCQRYYEVVRFHGWSRSTDSLILGSGTYAQQKRAAPTVIYSKVSGGGSGTVTALTAANIYYAGAYQTGAGSSQDCVYQALASSEL